LNYADPGTEGEASTLLVGDMMMKADTHGLKMTVTTKRYALR